MCALLEPSVWRQPAGLPHTPVKLTPVHSFNSDDARDTSPDNREHRPARSEKRSWTVSTPDGRESLQSEGKKVLDAVHQQQGPKPHWERALTSVVNVQSHFSNTGTQLLDHSSRAYAAARLPMRYWLDEDTGKPNKEFLELLNSVGIQMVAWEQTTWYGEEVALLLLFCMFADREQSGLHVVKAMVTLDKLGVHRCRMHQELSNIATHRDLCPWEQLMFIWYVWTGVLEFSFGKEDAKSILRFTPALWPVHDVDCNNEVWKVCRSGAPQRWCECLGNPLACVYRLWAWLNIDLRPVEVAMHDTIRQVHGTEVAVYFVFLSSVIRSLGFLSVLVLPLIIWNARSNHGIECKGDECFKSFYVKIGRPMLALILCLWSCHLLRRWRLVYDALCHRWHIVQSSEHQKILPYSQEVVRESFKAYPAGSGSYPAFFRAVRTLLFMPCVFLCWLLISFMLFVTFWFEMWIVYVWADCRAINRKAGEAGQKPSCDGADKSYGFFGTIVEGMPGLLEGMLFEIAKVFAHRCSKLVCDFQNWRTYTQYKTAYRLQVYSLEFISKFCVIGSLAFFFVPDWSPHDKPYWAITKEDCYELFMGSWGPSCLQIRIPYELRLKLLEQSMVGCFIVAPIVSMLITCVVPYFFRSCVSCGVEGYLRRWRLWRLLVIAFYYEEDALGGCWAYVFTGKERPVHYLRQDGVALSSSKTPVMWSTIVRQGYQQVFRSTHGYIDLLLHVNFIATFGVVFPAGVIINLLIVTFRLRGEMFMVLFEKQRRLHHSAQQTEMQQRWVDIILVCQLLVAVVFNSLLLMLPFRTLEYWAPEYQNKPLRSFRGDLTLSCLGVVTCFGFVLLVLKDLLHFLPMPALRFLQDFRQHTRSQQIDLDYALRRDCNKALEECKALREKTQRECEALRSETQKECNALRQELKQELTEFRRWQSVISADGHPARWTAGMPTRWLAGQPALHKTH